MVFPYSERSDNMNIFIYAKLQEPVSAFDDVINSIKSDTDTVSITTENKRSFRELERIKNPSYDSVYVISSLSSLGINDAEISNQLNWFIENCVLLVICDVPATYQFGVLQPMNQAVLATLLQSLTQNKNIVAMPAKRSNSGRNRLPFPDNWDELYEQWTNQKITSGQFLQMSGLKKATFYNLLTEYKNIQAANEQYSKRYKII